MLLQKKRYLIAADFDETAFHTFSPSPNGMDVKKAYQFSLDDIFGKGYGKISFLNNPSLHNHTPSQIISDLLFKIGEYKQGLIDEARNFFNNQQGNWGISIPECNNGRLFWNSDSPQTTITQMLVLQKLKYLLNEVGQRNNEGKVWPQPCKGFLEFIDVVSKLKKEDVPIDTAIISSGHESFIRKTFDVWNIPQPDILITEDDIRPREYPQEPEIRFKPGVFPLALAHHAWLKKQGLTNENSLVHEGKQTKRRIAYIGDSEQKDMEMARKGNVDGYLFPKVSWENIVSTLITRACLFDGRPIQEVLSPLRNGLEGSFAKGKEKL